MVSFPQVPIPGWSEPTPCRAWWPGARDVLCPALVHQVVLKAWLRLLSDFPQWYHGAFRKCPKKYVGLGTRCWWHQAGAHLEALPAGFVGAEMKMGSLLNNSRVEEFLPGHSHRVTLPLGVIMCVVYLWFL